MSKILFCFSFAFSLIGQSYYVSQLPPLVNLSPTQDLIPVWSGTNLYSATPYAIAQSSTAGKLNATNGSAVNLSVTGSFSTVSGTSPLLVDDVNDRVHIRGNGGGSPFNVIANNVRFGANDGAPTVSAISPAFNKDISFYSYDYNLNDWGLFRGESTSGANTFTLGFGSGGAYGTTSLRVKLGSSTVDSSGTLAGVWALSSGLVSYTPVSVNGLATTFFADPTNNVVHLRGGGGAMPFNVIANAMRFGADDGVATNSSITVGVDKDLTFFSYDRTNQDVGFLRFSSDLSNHTLNVGGGPGGYRAPTVVNIQGSSSLSSTSRYTIASFDFVNNRIVFGGNATVNNSVFSVKSTNQAAIPAPLQSSSEWNAYTPPQGSVIYESTANKFGVYDGTTRRYLSEELVGSVVWDIPSITSGTEQTTTVTITGASTGDQVLIDKTHPAANVFIVGEVTSANTITLYAMNTGATVDPSSKTYYITVKRR